MRLTAVLLVLGTAAISAAAGSPSPPSPLRVWIDKVGGLQRRKCSQRWLHLALKVHQSAPPSLLQYAFGPSETDLLEAAVAAGAGGAALAGVTRARMFETKGHHALAAHNFLWTGQEVSAHPALQH
jgi:hypothetical protein